jgi:RNA polymerase sigma factor for flagellar operon FliA
MTTVKSGASRTKPSRLAGRAPVTGETLLARYRRRPSVKLRDLLVERYRGYVEGIARQLVTRLPRRVDVQDLVHAGVWGLLQAIEKFRHERGVPFLPFMRARARGAMLDELRNMDYLPRLYRIRARERDAAFARLRSRLSRDPSDSELAQELGISEVRLRRSWGTAPDVIVGPSEPVNRLDDAGIDQDPLDSLPDDGLESPIEALNRRDLLAKIQSSLQPIEWKVLRMHYLEGMSGKEVARKLRLSASRICQIHVRVLSRLKSRLASREPA